MIEELSNYLHAKVLAWRRVPWVKENAQGKLFTFLRGEGGRDRYARLAPGTRKGSWVLVELEPGFTKLRHGEPSGYQRPSFVDVCSKEHLDRGDFKKIAMSSFDLDVLERHPEKVKRAVMTWREWHSSLRCHHLEEAREALLQELEENIS